MKLISVRADELRKCSGVTPSDPNSRKNSQALTRALLFPIPSGGFRGKLRGLRIEQEP
ncbi:MAG: hypothetical protein IH987_13080 [Planctomycetes bacterium]|nr:hypothetical protein [Planctomycetota bacterium]